MTPTIHPLVSNSDLSAVIFGVLIACIAGVTWAVISNELEQRRRRLRRPHPARWGWADERPEPRPRKCRPFDWERDL